MLVFRGVTCPLFKGTNLSVGNTTIWTHHRFSPRCKFETASPWSAYLRCFFAIHGKHQNAGFWNPGGCLPQCWDILLYTSLYIQTDPKRHCCCCFSMFLFVFEMFNKKRIPQSVVGNYHGRKLSFLNETIHKSGSLESMYIILLLQASPPPQKKD